MSSSVGNDVVSFDNATTLLTFSPPYTSMAAVFVGSLKGPSSSYASFIPAFEAELPRRKLTVVEFAKRLGDFFSTRTNEEPKGGPTVRGFVCGFDDGDLFGRAYFVQLPLIAECPPLEMYAGEEFGLAWDGQRDVLSRLILGYSASLPTVLADGLKVEPSAGASERIEAALQPLRARIPVELMALQDCVELAQFLIRTTMDMQRFTVGRRGVGGAINVATSRPRGWLAPRGGHATRMSPVPPPAMSAGWASGTHRYTVQYETTRVPGYRLPGKTPV